MKIFDWILGTYLALAIVVFFRMFYIGYKIAKNSGDAISVGDHVPSMISDSLFWGYFVIWFGLRSFLNDLKRPM
jgi:hypothetical protein